MRARTARRCPSSSQPAVYSSQIAWRFAWKRRLCLRVRVTSTGRPETEARSAACALDVEVFLGAERAARGDLGDADAVLRDPEEGRNLAAVVPDALALREDVQRPILLRHDEGRLRLEECVLDELRAVALGDDVRSSRQRRVDVASLDLRGPRALWPPQRTARSPARGPRTRPRPGRRPRVPHGASRRATAASTSPTYAVSRPRRRTGASRAVSVPCTRSPGTSPPSPRRRHPGWARRSWCRCAGRGPADGRRAQRARAACPGAVMSPTNGPVAERELLAAVARRACADTGAAERRRVAGLPRFAAAASSIASKIFT